MNKEATGEAMPLTDTLIGSYAYSYGVVKSDTNNTESFINGAKWARERMLETMFQEVEKAFEAGKDFEWDTNYGPIPTKSPSREEYLTKIKEKYGI